MPHVKLSFFNIFFLIKELDYQSKMVQSMPLMIIDAFRKKSNFHSEFQKCIMSFVHHGVAFGLNYVCFKWRGHPLKGTVSRKKYSPYPFQQGFFLALNKAIAEPLPLPRVSNIVVFADALNLCG